MHGGDGVTAMQICLMALNSALKHGRSGQCYVKCNLPQFTMGERSLRGPGTDGQEGVRPGWKAEGIALTGGEERRPPAGPFPGWLCLGTAGCPHVLRFGVAATQPGDGC